MELGRYLETSNVKTNKLQRIANKARTRFVRKLQIVHFQRWRKLEKISQFGVTYPQAQYRRTNTRIILKIISYLFT